ncbi:hypothetical protein SAMN05444920_11066 [Nonomuraea solani]|uniref:Uncharacterized protein n=1 Tax=Nonomuraea solani TaxID=1144553 RepID=A0A1H6EIL9_9ACTN|nr:hypothetical protein SAMN05444920_11066 [Nonomuraea solani]
MKRPVSANRVLLAVVVAWIMFLTVLILLDPRAAGA